MATSRYIQAGDSWKYDTIEGNFLPENNPSGGYLQFGLRSSIPSPTRYLVTYGERGLYFSNAMVLRDFILTEPYGKTICAVNWTNGAGQSCQWILSNPSVGVINSTLRNISLNRTVRNTSVSFANYLQWISNNSTDKGVYFCPVYTDPTNYPGYCDVGVYSRDATINFGRDQYFQLGQWNIDAQTSGSDAAIAYNMFYGLGIDDFDTGDASTASPPGSGSFTYTDVKIDFPDLPTLSPVTSGLLGLYKLSSEQLQALAAWLWSPNFFDNIIKNFTSPFENLISLNILPLTIAGGLETIKIGNLDSGCVGARLSGQFLDADFGQVSIPKIFGNQLDFPPASTCKIYLPYIGFRDIDLNDASGGIIHLKYRIDLLTGVVVALIRIVQTDRYSHDSVEYMFNGNCATPIPLSGSNWISFFGSLVGGGLSAAVGVSTSNPLMVAGGVSSILNAKPEYQHGGSLGSAAGYMSVQKAFILLDSPIQSIAGNIKHLEGLRSNVTAAFSGLSGFQKIESYTPTTGLAAECTAEELQEIKNLLMEGVYF